MNFAVKKKLSNNRFPRNHTVCCYNKGIPNLPQNIAMITYRKQGEDGKTYTLKDVLTIKDMDLSFQSIKASLIMDKFKYLGVQEFQELECIQPKLFIGQDNRNLIVSREVIEGPPDSPVLSRTK